MLRIAILPNLVTAAVALLFFASPRNAQPSSKTVDHPDQACASCHREIYDRYQRTPMAHASGLATDGLITGQFLHSASGVQYNIFERGGEAWLTYHRSVKTDQPALDGEQRLDYYIGSGRRGRTYLFDQEGWWFESPINYYSRKRLWDMAPAFSAARTMPLTLAVDPNCLHCHASQVKPSLPEARNRYPQMPFRQGGIGCAACHGDPSAHLAATAAHRSAAGTIINPAVLAPARRDAVCLQCHLEGDVTVFLAGKSLSTYTPGDNLGDHVVHFIDASRETSEGRATSQYEALLRSACKRASGDRLTCTTCHDPHGSPLPKERVAFFRAQCLSCHAAPRFAEQHHPEQPDCASCHMPRRQTEDIAHEQLTDHDIEARPHAPRKAVADKPTHSSARLTAISGETFRARELGIAYAQLARQGDRHAGEQALSLLQKAEQDGEADAQVHLELGFLDQESGNIAAARKEYQAVLSVDPFQAAAAADLAVIDAGLGDVAAAIGLLQRVVHDDPAQTAAGLNLAFIECRLGEKKQAREVLQRVLTFNPDSPDGNRLLDQGMYQNQHCSLK